MRHCDFPASVPASLDYAKRYLPPASVFVSPAKPDAGLGPGLFLCRSSLPVSSGRRRGISQVPGESYRAYALFTDPGRTRPAWPIPRAGAAPAWPKAKAPTIRPISGLKAGLEHSLSTLRPPGYPGGRKTHLRCGPGSPQRDFHPQDSYERFLRCFLHRFLLSQAYLTQWPPWPPGQRLVHRPSVAANGGDRHAIPGGQRCWPPWPPPLADAGRRGGPTARCDNAATAPSWFWRETDAGFRSVPVVGHEVRAVTPDCGSHRRRHWCQRPRPPCSPLGRLDAAPRRAAAR
jgi:hypothetical protein